MLSVFPNHFTLTIFRQDFSFIPEHIDSDWTGWPASPRTLTDPVPSALVLLSCPLPPRFLPK